MADRIPNPHRDEPTPAPDKGLRPEADPSVVRPEQEEELGPIPGLMKTAAAEAVSEITDSPEAEAQEADAGVEDEGIESGQIIGITAAILISVLLIGVTVFWAFYLPELGETRDEAESSIELLPDGLRLNAEAEALIGDYTMKADSTFTLPIGLAMEDVAERYAGDAAVAALDGGAVAGGMPLAVTRQGFNVAPIALAPARAVRSASARGADTAPVPEVATPEPDLLDGTSETGEEIGIDAVDVDGASGGITSPPETEE